MITKDYLDNRARIPFAELAAHQGKWAAFSPDGRQVIASAETVERLDSLLVASGMKSQDVVLEWVVGPDEDCKLGASEWQ